MRREEAIQVKLIEVVAKKGNADTIKALAEDSGALDWRVIDVDDGARECVRIVTAAADRQKLVDSIESLLATSGHWRLTILPVDATSPKIELSETEATAERARAISATREELYGTVAGGAAIDGIFLTLVLLSTLVAGIGLLTDNVAVVIGAMVIAPLLGPNLAFALGAALGDAPLMGRAARANLVGLAIAIGLSGAYGALVGTADDSHELMARTEVDYASVVLALASGAAAALSLTTGLSTTLVGVMVAVALLPPAVTAGLMAGAGHWPHAIGAVMLLAVNVVSVNLAALLVFAIRGIKPRSWLQQRASRQSTVLSFATWGALLALIFLLIFFRHR